ncbi:uncharacterized protein [Chelonus insularis]|uniref:uncharacterized protein n=1 Tax=Chelonus insularis TaxID=460826 RepID=UPI00158E6832|nr:uncharacterized protein LOC118064710 [Chelonus insularis]XP_034935398.1 uncharacterized protein LOC118064710 [Chelonus insularis]
MATPKINEKLCEVLELFLLPNYVVASTTYLDLLLSHISNSISQSNTKNDELSWIVKEWLLKASDTWNTEFKPCQAVIVFTLKLAGTIGKNSDDFVYLQKDRVFDKLLEIFNLEENNLPASIKMAYTSMLLDIVGYEEGRKWIKTSGVWKDIVKFSHLNHTMYVTRESHKFITELLINDSQNIQFCTEVLQAVCEPIINNTFNPQIHTTLEDIYLDQTRVLSTTLEIITSILENTLFFSTDNTIPKLLVELIDLEARVKALLEACISTKFLSNIQKLWILLILYNVKCGWETNNEGKTIVNQEHWDKFRLGYCYMQTLFISKKYIIEVARTNKYALIYWKKLTDLKHFSLPHKDHQFEHQVVALMITPLLVCLRKGYKHDLFEIFMDKMFNITCLPILRLTYEVRDVMLREDLPVELISKSCVEMLLEIIDIMDRETAVIAFQSMCHVLKNYVSTESYSNSTTLQNHNSNNCYNNLSPELMIDDTTAESPILLSALIHGCNNHHEEYCSRPASYQKNDLPKSILDGDPIVENPVLLSTLLHGVAIMTEKFQFKWRDCVETICVLFLAQGILNHSGTLPNICVKALKLCKLAIENFMPPNLALLVNSESHMNNIGPTLYKRLHDPNWEVRDSALEVLHVIADISENTYPAFQELLLTNQLIPLITDMAMKDGESYVRASALKFIAITTRINNLWDRELSRLDLLEKTSELFKNESEAIVRKEAIALIKELYVHRKWPKATLKAINDIMVEAAILDLHWEVKINALKYWRHLMTVDLNDQGMLDGEFPNVTFSKEHRKIVTLDEREIKNLINKAMDTMAKQNCLGVLLLTLEDESDFEVSKNAANIIQELKGLLLKYNVHKVGVDENIFEINNSTLDTVYVNQPSNSTNYQESNSSNDLSRVIDDIIDSNDASLLASIYKNVMKMDEDSGNRKQEILERISKITREQFLSTILNSDINAYIEERCRWLNTYTVSFDSVLEDILTVYQQKDINTMDCY